MFTKRLFSLSALLCLVLCLWLGLAQAQQAGSAPAVEAPKAEAPKAEAPESGCAQGRARQQAGERHRQGPPGDRARPWWMTPSPQGSWASRAHRA